VEITAERTLRHVLRAFDVTFTKVTALVRDLAPCDGGYRRVAVVGHVTAEVII
jgi:hypothetical protein